MTIFPLPSIAAAFVFLAIFSGVSLAHEPAGDRVTADETMPVAPATIQTLDTAKTPRDALINEINNELKKPRRSRPTDELIRTHTQIATLIGELRRVSPDDRHVATLLPERWLSLKFLARLPSKNSETLVDRMRELNSEIDEVLKTTTDSRLKCDASFYHAVFQFDDPIDGPAAVSLAEGFVREWPQDNRSAEILHKAMTKLHSAWSMRIGVIVLLALVSAVTAISSVRPQARTRKWLKRGMLLGLIGIAMSVILMTAYPHFPGVRKIESVASRLIRRTVTWAHIQIFAQNFLSLVCTYRFGLVVVLASATALLLVVIRKRSKTATLKNMPIACRLILGFLLALAVCFAGDAYLISRQNTEVMRRLAQGYPNSFRGRLARGQLEKRKRVGKPFELEFTDEISGRAISMKNMRGKVVVVIFWATWCGPCIAELPEMKRLYAKYHDQGVEFIGVSQDLPEKDGGLEKLIAFLEKEKIPWPQYYQGHDDSAFATGSAESVFSESWGVDEIPTVFLINAHGNLYSTEARGQLDTLIPLVLRE